jgi:hypothetical protein
MNVSAKQGAAVVIFKNSSDGCHVWHAGLVSRARQACQRNDSPATPSACARALGQQPLLGRKDFSGCMHPCGVDRLIDLRGVESNKHGCGNNTFHSSDSSAVQCVIDEVRRKVQQKKLPSYFMLYVFCTRTGLCYFLGPAFGRRRWLQ